jgi:hypothetical protein
MWRKRAETHGEANLHLIKFASALRDQASQIARDRNELEQRCFLLKRQLDGESVWFFLDWPGLTERFLDLRNQVDPFHFLVRSLRVLDQTPGKGVGHQMTATSLEF